MRRKEVTRSEKLKATKYLIDLMPKNMLAEYIVDLQEELENLTQGTSRTKAASPLAKFLKA